MSDPIEVIDRLFKRLAGTYVAGWDRSLGQVPIADVKSVWLHELSGFLKSPAGLGSIKWALDNLPERCPNAIEFRNLCRQAPSPEVPALPMPAPNPEMAKMVAEQLRKTTPAAGMTLRDRGEWAYRILARHKGGEKISPAALKMARDGLTALGLPFDHQ